MSWERQSSNAIEFKKQKSNQPHNDRKFHPYSSSNSQSSRRQSYYCATDKIKSISTISANRKNTRSNVKCSKTQSPPMKRIQNSSSSSIKYKGLHRNQDFCQNSVTTSHNSDNASNYLKFIKNAKQNNNCSSSILKNGHFKRTQIMNSFNFEGANSNIEERAKVCSLNDDISVNGEKPSPSKEVIFPPNMELLNKLHADCANGFDNHDSTDLVKTQSRSGGKIKSDDSNISANKSQSISNKNPLFSSLNNIGENVLSPDLKIHSLFGEMNENECKDGTIQCHSSLFDFNEHSTSFVKESDHSSVKDDSAYGIAIESELVKSKSSCSTKQSAKSKNCKVLPMKCELKDVLLCSSSNGSIIDNDIIYSPVNNKNKLKRTNKEIKLPKSNLKLQNTTSDTKPKISPHFESEKSSESFGKESVDSLIKCNSRINIGDMKIDNGQMDDLQENSCTEINCIGNVTENKSSTENVTKCLRSSIIKSIVNDDEKAIEECKLECKTFLSSNVPSEVVKKTASCKMLSKSLLKEKVTVNRPFKTKSLYKTMLNSLTVATAKKGVKTKNNTALKPIFDKPAAIKTVKSKNLQNREICRTNHQWHPQKESSNMNIPNGKTNKLLCKKFHSNNVKYKVTDRFAHYKSPVKTGKANIIVKPAGAVKAGKTAIKVKSNGARKSVISNSSLTKHSLIKESKNIVKAVNSKNVIRTSPQNVFRNLSTPVQTFAQTSVQDKSMKKCKTDRGNSHTLSKSVIQVAKLNNKSNDMISATNRNSQIFSSSKNGNAKLNKNRAKKTGIPISDSVKNVKSATLIKRLIANKKAGTQKSCSNSPEEREIQNINRNKIKKAVIQFHKSKLQQYNNSPKAKKSVILEKLKSLHLLNNNVEKEYLPQLNSFDGIVSLGSPKKRKKRKYYKGGTYSLNVNGVVSRKKRKMTDTKSSTGTVTPGSPASSTSSLLKRSDDASDCSKSQSSSSSTSSHNLNVVELRNMASMGSLDQNFMSTGMQVAKKSFHKISDSQSNNNAGDSSSSLGKKNCDEILFLPDIVDFDNCSLLFDCNTTCRNIPLPETSPANCFSMPNLAIKSSSGRLKQVDELSTNSASSSSSSKKNYRKPIVNKTVPRETMWNLRPSENFFKSELQSGDVNNVITVLANGANPNYKFRNDENNTPLHIAATLGFLPVIQLLIQSGALLDSVNNELRTPLMLAAERKHSAIVRYLLTSGAEVLIKDISGMSCLHIAAQSGDMNSIHLILEAGFRDLDMQDDGGWTPLVWACEHARHNVTKYLLQCGASPNIRDKEYNIALHWAAFSGDTKSADAIIDTGCNVNSVNKRKDTPLHVASRNNRFECVLLLVSRGALTNITNHDNLIPSLCCPDFESTTFKYLESWGIKSVIKYSTNLRIEKYSDIARGKELFPIEVVNNCDNEEFNMDFCYTTTLCESPNIHINKVVNSVNACSCCGICSRTRCTCSELSVRLWYDKKHCLIADFDMSNPPVIFECSKMCSCSQHCLNRVVQHGSRCHFQLFRAHGKGWGVKLLHDVDRGSFICEYLGEIVTDAEAERREDDSYLLDLESDSKACYCLDAKFYGNISRFINHSCAPNLTAVKVFIDHHDLSFPRVALFSNRDIKAYEELSFDYGEKFWLIKSNYFFCMCGVANCKYSGDSINSIFTKYKSKLKQGKCTRTKKAS